MLKSLIKNAQKFDQIYINSSTNHNKINIYKNFFQLRGDVKSTMPESMEYVEDIRNLCARMKAFQGRYGCTAWVDFVFCCCKNKCKSYFTVIFHISQCLQYSTI